MLRPDSPAHEVTGDIRLYLGAGYALLMQVSHPTVGAGSATTRPSPRTRGGG